MLTHVLDCTFEERQALSTRIVDTYEHLHSDEDVIIEGIKKLYADLCELHLVPDVVEDIKIPEDHGHRFNQDSKMALINILLDMGYTKFIT